jgi:hypothetical protein
VRETLIRTSILYNVQPVDYSDGDLERIVIRMGF